MTKVALFTRAWIEMTYSRRISSDEYTSPSSRGRGLKSDEIIFVTGGFTVALFTRAWIEMLSIICCEVVTPVALFTRAWIEIASQNYKDHVPLVALFTRAWIEISKKSLQPCLPLSPSSRGRGLKYAQYNLH